MTTKRRRDGISYRSFDDSWYSSLTGKYAPLIGEDGKKVKGKGNETQAKLAYARLQLSQAAPSEQKTTNKVMVGSVLEAYLAYLKKDHPKSVKVAQWLLKDFAAYVDPCRNVETLKRSDFYAWVGSHKNWGDSTQCQGGQVLCAAFNHATHLGLIQTNPMAGIKKKTPKKWVQVFTKEQETAIFKVAPKPFADYFAFLLATGCRPDEAARIEAKHLKETPNGLQVVLEEHKTSHKTDKPRVIYCNAQAAQLLRHLSQRNPSGLLFVTKRSKPWTQQRRSASWDRIRTKAGLPDDMVPYATRHTAATRWLASGVPIATVAALLGNTVQVCERNYCHLHKMEETIWGAVAQLERHTATA